MRKESTCVRLLIRCGLLYSRGRGCAEGGARLLLQLLTYRGALRSGPLAAEALSSAALSPPLPLALRLNRLRTLLAELSNPLALLPSEPDVSPPLPLPRPARLKMEPSRLLGEEAAESTPLSLRGRRVAGSGAMGQGGGKGKPRVLLEQAAGSRVAG